MKAAAEILFNGSFPSSLTYDKTKVTMLTRRLRQYSLSAAAVDKFAAPQLPTIARVQEVSGVSGMMPYVWAYSPTIDYVFLADNTTAGSTRQFMCYSWDKVNHIYSYIGRITVTFPNATNFTIRGLRALNRRYATGTVSAISSLQASVPWTRSTTTATVSTGGAHGLTTGQSMRVTVTSDATAIVLGIVSITVTGTSTYTFTCLNAGGASGTVTIGASAGESAVTWTRSSTTATIAHTAHPFITGQQIRVLVTSDAAAIVLGIVTVTVTGVNSYTFTCLNAGGASGSLTITPVGTIVTGVSTAWLTNKIQTGCRIGFGSNDYSVISAWYDILSTSQIMSDTTLLLTADILPVASGNYVIEETMLAVAMTNATTTNGGLFVVKGLSVQTFQIGNVNVPAATTFDNVRAAYWLKDAATVTNVTAAGMTIEYASDTGTLCYGYVLEGSATTLRVYKYDLRKSLTLAAGIDTTSLVLSTGNYATTGNISQNNNGRIGTLTHGPGSGVSCLYMITSTRVYRIPVSAITSGSTTFPADAMTENPPGSIASFPATAGLNAIDISDTTDRLVILTGTPRAYVTQYRTDAGQFDNVFGIDSRQLDQSTSDTNLTPAWNSSGPTPVNSVFTESGFMHIIRNTTATTTNIMYCTPLAADWQYASINGDRVVTPEITLIGGAKKLYRLMVNEVHRVGSAALCMETMGFRSYWRTSGINDNSGSWTLLADDFDLSGAGAPASIQFMFEFKILGYLMNPARILGLAVIYETDDSLPPELRWSVLDSDNTNGTVGVIQDAVFTTLSLLTINYYRADNDVLVLTQASSSTTNGVWEQWNGSAWVAGLGSNVLNQRRRFRPTAGLPTGVDVYAKVAATA